MKFIFRKRIGMHKEKKKLLIINLILIVLLVVLDQVTKYLAVIKLKDKPSIAIIENVFELHYLENRGAAFGMLQGQKIFFVCITVVILAVIAYVFVKMPDDKKYNKMNITLVFIVSGAIGNLIDRISYNYVVDFLYFKLIDFPVFNVADIYVTLASIYFAILILFVYKDSDLNFLNKNS